jgi:hypothetical protein
VVTGGLKDYHYAQTLWGRYVRYETALSKTSVSEYVCKYASKVPVTFGTSDWLNYLQATYKLRLHRFSTKQGEITKSDWVPVPSLINELKRASNRGRSRREDGTYADYVPYNDTPPPPDDDIPACVSVNKFQTWTADSTIPALPSNDTYENYSPPDLLKPKRDKAKAFENERCKERQKVWRINSENYLQRLNHLKRTICEQQKNGDFSD